MERRRQRGENQDDDVLWRRAALGDGPAFAELFERHADPVDNHCFRRMGSWDDAAETTSIVFLEAWRRRREVVLSTPTILPRLLAVANNVLRNERRARRRHRYALERLPPPSHEADHADDVAGRRLRRVRPGHGPGHRALLHPAGSR